MAHWRFGLIGCGSIADMHAEAVRGIQHASLTIVSSRDEAKAKAFAERERCNWTTDYKEMLNRTDVDIVCVTTSSGSHAAIGLDVLEAGKHLVVEKPIAMNARDAQAMIDKAEEKGVTLSVISQRRFESNTQAIKRVLEGGALGKLLLAEVSLPYYRSQEYYDSAEWRGTISQDGGVIMNQGIHCLDLMLWFAGKVRTVFGKTATQTHHIEAEDLGLAILRFESGAYGTIMASTSVTPGYAASISLIGERGAIKLEGFDITRWSVPGWDEPNRSEIKTSSGVSDPKNIDSDYHQRQLLNVMAAIERGVSPICSGEDGMRAVQLVETIYKSAAEGKEITLGS